MRVRWLRVALANLDDEARFIANDNPQAARAVVASIHEAVSLLESQPALGHPGRVPGTRELLVSGTSYLVPYRVRSDTVEILRVFHTSRRGPQHW